MIRTQISEELLTKLWLLMKEQANGTFYEKVNIFKKGLIKTFFIDSFDDKFFFEKKKNKMTK